MKIVNWTMYKLGFVPKGKYHEELNKRIEAQHGLVWEQRYKDLQQAYDKLAYNQYQRIDESIQRASMITWGEDTDDIVIHIDKKKLAYVYKQLGSDSIEKDTFINRLLTEFLRQIDAAYWSITGVPRD